MFTDYQTGFSEQLNDKHVFSCETFKIILRFLCGSGFIFTPVIG